MDGWQLTISIKIGDDNVGLFRISCSDKERKIAHSERLSSFARNNRAQMQQFHFSMEIIASGEVCRKGYSFHRVQEHDNTDRNKHTKYTLQAEEDHFLLLTVPHTLTSSRYDLLPTCDAHRERSRVFHGRHRAPRDQRKPHEHHEERYHRATSSSKQHRHEDSPRVRPSWMKKRRALGGSHQQ